MSEETQATVKKQTEVKAVKMTDGRTVNFAGKRKMIKTVVEREGHYPSVLFDFVNGETRRFDIHKDILHRLAAHGASQKIGDETAGESEVEDQVIAVETMIERLNKGEWGATRTPGDSFSGSSIVIRAICEVTGKDAAFVKAFLANKLAAAEERGEKLTRAALYSSFRNPNSKTGAVIKRLEEEKLAKSSAVNADELLDSIEI